MRRFKIIIVGLLGLLIYSNCEKDESENENTIFEDQIFYQEFDIDTTNYENDTILYDIDGDEINDFQLIKEIEINGNNVQYGGSMIEILDEMRFCYLKTIPEMDFVDIGDEIKDSEIYDWVNQVKYSGSTSIYFENEYWAYGIFTDYFGFELEKNNQKYYGWFHLKHFELKEIGFNKTPNKSIIVGQKN